VPVNRIEMLATAARSIPIGWALDAEHQPTTDPASVAKMVPLGGSQSWGGHKGFGLSIAVWILSGLLSGGWRSNPQPDRVLGGAGETQHGFGQEGIGHAFAAIRLDQFGDPAAIKRGLDAMILAFNESPPVPGFDRVLVPGQIEFETQQQRRRTGIPIAQTTLAELQSLAEQFQIPW
jgi:LDH2 family malate/lactate/ureidoglycolate dehydrogenase